MELLQLFSRKGHRKDKEDSREDQGAKSDKDDPGNALVKEAGEVDQQAEKEPKPVYFYPQMTDLTLASYVLEQHRTKQKQEFEAAKSGKEELDFIQRTAKDVSDPLAYYSEEDHRHAVTKSSKHQKPTAGHREGKGSNRRHSTSSSKRRHYHRHHKTHHKDESTGKSKTDEAVEEDDGTSPILKVMCSTVHNKKDSPESNEKSPSDRRRRRPKNCGVVLTIQDSGDLSGTIKEDSFGVSVTVDPPSSKKSITAKPATGEHHRSDHQIEFLETHNYNVYRRESNT